MTKPEAVWETLPKGPDGIGILAVMLQAISSPQFLALLSQHLAPPSETFSFFHKKKISVPRWQLSIFLSILPIEIWGSGGLFFIRSDLVSFNQSWQLFC